ncbi:hypothetical protein Drorol1_Dr00020889 [Drosera rotundifolia]
MQWCHHSEAFAVFLVPAIIIPHFYHIIRGIEQSLDSNSGQSELVLEIEDRAKLLQQSVDSSAANLARYLSSTIAGYELTFASIGSKVAPPLFEALSTLPLLTQVSYISSDGLFFSYYKDGTHTFAVYSNTTFASNSSIQNPNYTWYTQLVHSENGALYGDVGTSRPFNVTNSSWFLKSLNRSDGCTSLGGRWDSMGERLLLSTASVYGTRGVISFGFPVKTLMDIFSNVKSYDASLYLVTYDGEVLVQGLPKMSVTFDGNNTRASLDLVDSRKNARGYLGDVPCKVENGASFGASTFDIGGKKIKFYCSQIDVDGIQSVYVLAVPNKELENMIHGASKRGLGLVMGAMIALAIAVLCFLWIVVKAKGREVHLCSKLIKQMEATQQAERKSMNKSLAFASASHDMRVSLHGITGLVELSRSEVAPGSELETNLRLIDTCSKDLLELLNSILDMSKIEAGKMQLQEEEFSLSQLLEDVADLYHAVGIKKGVEVVLDYRYDSVPQIPLVKGDRGKLKQILCNLLSNAVKFTSEGHVTIRTWAEKPSKENTIMESKRNVGSFLHWISRLFSKNKREYDDLEQMRTIKQDPRCIEFTVEVDDTGVGIPKEKRQSVFENYVQVKETGVGTGGTGLGLGIVQSLVRLMGGEIEILDKDHEERGTCFSFNVFLLVCDETTPPPSIEFSLKANSEYDYQHAISDELCPDSDQKNNTSSGIVILIQNSVRRRMIKECMERHGIRPEALRKGSELPGALKKIKEKILSKTLDSSSGLSDLSPRFCLSTGASSSGLPKKLPMSSMEGKDVVPSLGLGRRALSKGSLSFVLIIIDTAAGDFSELSRSVAEFRKDLYGNSNASCKVVWLEKPETREHHFRGLNEDNLAETDQIMTMPLQGSRLYQLIRLLPELRGKSMAGGSFTWSRSHAQVTGNLVIPTPFSMVRDENVTTSKNVPTSVRTRALRVIERKRVQGEIEETSSSDSEWPLERRRWSVAIRDRIRHEASESQSSGSEKSLPMLGRGPMMSRYGSIEELGSPRLSTVGSLRNWTQGQSTVDSLEGKQVVIAEDNQVLRTLANGTVSQLGASVVLCQNGSEALKLVCEGLKKETGHFAKLPFDYILMDCEMPVMDGYEATRRIREEEEKHGVHIPIIALTAHTADEQGSRITEAGMDYHLTKPLSKEKLLDAIAQIHRS